ncbi:hypothetical protein OUZ56_004334 [Daphnia magna]|uniref:Uncharacterized protein n=1 Tax=Daphnia magna TaxID=35525 RepID=A0ABQ9YPH1_9CRUS|nr:hypothetical protein OUZ56_004334 [Daphnia magna]
MDFTFKLVIRLYYCVLPLYIFTAAVNPLKIKEPCGHFGQQTPVKKIALYLSRGEVGRFPSGQGCNTALIERCGDDCG